MRDVLSKQVGCAFHLHSIFAAGPLNFHPHSAFAAGPLTFHLLTTFAAGALNWVVTYNIGGNMLQHPSCQEGLQYTE